MSEPVVSEGGLTAGPLLLPGCPGIPAPEFCPLGVVTSAPPHWTHDAGRRIAAALRVPFVMDMRDPWSLFEQLMERLASPLTFYFTRTREERGVKAASLVVANTEQARRALSAQGSRAGDPQEWLRRVA